MALLSGTGIKLQMDDGSGNFSDVAQLETVEWSGGTTNTTETPRHDATNDMLEFVTNMVDAGEINISGHFDPQIATHDDSGGLMDVWKNKKDRQFKIVLNDSSNSTLTISSAFITSFESSQNVDDSVSFTATIDINGDITLFT